MRRALAAIALATLAALLPAAPASAEFGFSEVDVRFTDAGGAASLQAGSHPYAMVSELDFNTHLEEGEEVLDGSPKDLVVELPVGFAGDPRAVPVCSTVDFLLIDKEHPGSACPEATALGVLSARSPGQSGGDLSPAFNLAPPPGAVAKLGFVVATVPVSVIVRVSPDPPYRVIATLGNISNQVAVAGSELTLWGNPFDPRHDGERGSCLGDPEQGCPVSLAERPFLTLPRRCAGPGEMLFSARSWEQPDIWAQAAAATNDALDPPTPQGMVECPRLGFTPEISARPTARAASSPTGLDFELLTNNEESLRNPAEGAVADADIEKAVVTLPAGMTINPSQAEGLEVCSEADLARETLAAGPGEGCPQAAKIGSVEVRTPLLEGEVLSGALFVAEPYANLAADSLIAFYIVIKDRDLGVLIKQPARVDPDPESGRLVSTAEDLPQLPFSSFRLRFREGARSPLISPPGCGSFAVEALLYPSSGNPPAQTSSTFEIVSGPNESPCPSGAAPFEPGFGAGTANNAAGRYSPFQMRITRADGEQDLIRLSSLLPPGLAGKVAGIPYCPEEGIARARSRGGERGGRAELADPSCPQASLIGHTLAGAGAGSQLTYVPGSLYLAGPYNDAPLSVVSITPALAGPFDAGAVVVRFGLKLDPVSAEVQVDGSASDPIPHILQGIPLTMRDLRAEIDRPGLTLNATSCKQMQIGATLWGGGTPLAPLEGVPLQRSARYQAASCGALGFRPRIAMRLRGASARGGFPALRVAYTPRRGDANVSRLALLFPRSAFIEQGHFRTICTRVQFAAAAGHGAGCPRGSIYGRAKVWTPLLDEPLQGPVFLRSSDHNLPDAVLALRGLVEIELSVRIDSRRGRLRAIVPNAPDAPVSRALVVMRGGQKGLFVNSRDLCTRRSRASVRLRAHNTRRRTLRPLVRARGCAKPAKRSRGPRR